MKRQLQGSFEDKRSKPQAADTGCNVQKQYVEGQVFEYSEHITWPKVVRLLRTPSAMCCILQASPCPALLACMHPWLHVLACRQITLVLCCCDHEPQAELQKDACRACHAQLLSRIVVQGVAGSLPWGVLLTFINDYLSQQQQLSVPQATLVRSATPLSECYLLLQLHALPIQRFNGHSSTALLSLHKFSAEAQAHTLRKLSH